MRYVRYADDFLLGFIGPREEAEAIKRRIGAFLHDQLGLELSETKTLITQLSRMNQSRTYPCDAPRAVVAISSPVPTIEPARM